MNDELREIIENIEAQLNLQSGKINDLNNEVDRLNKILNNDIPKIYRDVNQVIWEVKNLKKKRGIFKKIWDNIKPAYFIK